MNICSTNFRYVSVCLLLLRSIRIHLNIIFWVFNKIEANLTHENKKGWALIQNNMVFTMFHLLYILQNGHFAELHFAETISCRRHFGKDISLGIRKIRQILIGSTEHISYKFDLNSPLQCKHTITTALAVCTRLCNNQ